MSNATFFKTTFSAIARILGVALLLLVMVGQAAPSQVRAAGTADLTITDVKVLPDENRVTNEDVIIRLTVKNQGTAAAAPFYMDVYIDRDPASCADVGDYWYYLTTGLNPGAEEDIDIRIQIEDINDLDGVGRAWSGPGEKNVLVVLDLCNNVSESDKDNNTKTQSVLITEPPVLPPSHDELDSPTVIPALPFNDSQDIRGATLNLTTDKHVSQCELYRGAKSVWYQYQPESDTSVIFDTFTSDYDTYIAVWTGTPDNLTEVKCNDDARRTKQSRVGLRVTGGTMYYIQVSEYRFPWTPSPFAPLSLDSSERPVLPNVSEVTEPTSEVSPLATIGLLNFHAYVDNIPPVVDSIQHGDPSATLTATVRFIVKFSEDVVGVDVNDFALVKTGTITGESIASVAMLNGQEDTYTVTVNTGSGVGTLKLVVRDTATIEDIVGNVMTELPFTTGAVYKVRVQTFADVPTSYWAWQFIEQLYTAGITGGCSTSPLQYCPATTVTRDQMAVFLLRGIYGASYVPPAVGSSTGFADVPTTHWAAAWIKQLAAIGITGGCGGGNYCPASPVTRDQMAIFLLRAKYGSSYAPPPVGATTGFADVPTTYWAAAWIKQLAAEGITGGCGGGNYCPASPVTRDQMAVFLVRTFRLP
ncbi:MAG: S-layer homology domain-containing protein [Anaerolineales bacterium]